MQHFSVFLYFFLTFAEFCRKKSRVSRRRGQSLAALAQKKGGDFQEYDSRGTIFEPQHTSRRSPVSARVTGLHAFCFTASRAQNAEQKRNGYGTNIPRRYGARFASPRCRKILDAHGFPAIRNRSFSTISQCVHSAKSCILSNYTSHEKLDFRHPYFPSFSDSGATAHSVIFRKLPMCTFRQKLRPK